MSSIPASREILLAPADNVRLVELCGPLDEHLRLIEARLGIEVKRRGNRFQLVGMSDAILRGESVLQSLYSRAQREPVDSERVHIALQELDMDNNNGDTNTDSDELTVRTARRSVRARGSNQTESLPHVPPHDLTFPIGPAGTGRPICRGLRGRGAAVGKGAADCPGSPRVGRASGWDFYRRSFPKSTRTCARCMTLCTKCWVSNVWPS